MPGTYSLFDLGLDFHMNRPSSLIAFNTENTTDEVGAMAMVIPSSVNPERISAGEVPNITFVGKQSFSDTTAGFRMGIDTDGEFRWSIGNSGSGADWNVTTADTFTINGALSADSGTIGGFEIGTDYIRDAANSFGLASTVTGGDDVRFWAGSTFANRATAPFRVTEAGVVTASNITITGGSVTTSTFSGTIAQGNLDVANAGWSQTCAFSVTDLDTVAWGSGTFITASGTVYAINAGNTGNMSARTYIYLDTAVSTTAYQTTTTAATAVGAGKVLIATAINGTDEAVFETFGGVGGLNIHANSIVASSITANEIAASTITAGKLSITQLSAITADMGAITAGTITVVSGGNTVAITPGSTNAIISGPTGSPTFTLTSAGALSATSASFTTTNLINSILIQNNFNAGESITSGDAVCYINDLNQHTGDNDTPFGDATARTRIALRIIPRTTITSSSIYIMIYKTNTPVDNLTLEVQGDSSGAPDGTAITNGISNNLGGGSLTSKRNYQLFNFASAFTLTAGTTYWVVLKRSGAVDATNYYNVFYNSSGNAYGSFLGSLYNGTTWSSGATPMLLMTIIRDSGNPSTTVWKTNAGRQGVNSFVGFSQNSPTQGQACSIASSGVITNLSGLTPGLYYYISTTAGAISTTPGAYSVTRIGFALTSTSIQIESNLMHAYNGNNDLGTPAGGVTERSFIYTGFRPKIIQVSVGSNDSGEGSSWGTYTEANSGRSKNLSMDGINGTQSRQAINDAVGNIFGNSSHNGIANLTIDYILDNGFIVAMNDLSTGITYTPIISFFATG